MRVNLGSLKNSEFVTRNSQLQKFDFIYVLVVRSIAGM